MKKNKFSPLSFLSTLIELIDLQHSNTVITKYCNMISLVFYFSHTASILAKLPLNFSDSKLLFLLNVLYYTNFMNFLELFQVFALTIAIYVIVVVLLVFFVSYVILYSMLKNVFSKKKLHKSQGFTKIGSFMGAYFIYFFWIQSIPIIEILMNPLLCDAPGSFLSSCDEKFPLIAIIISVVAIILCFLVCFLHTYVLCGFRFLDLHSIRLQNDIFSLIFILLRNSLPILFVVSWESPYLIIMILHLFCALSLINFLRSETIANKLYSCLYLSLLLCLEFLCLSLSFSLYLEVLLEESLFYIIILGFILSFKLGFCYEKSHNFKLYVSNFQRKDLLDKCLEELYYRSDTFLGSNESFFLMYGMLKMHAKHCTSIKCKLKSKTMKKFESLNIGKKIKLVNTFILQLFWKEIELLGKSRHFNNETFCFKYLDFLLKSNANTSLIYYQMQRLKNFYKTRSLLGGVIIKFLMKKIQKKIMDIEREKSISQNKDSENLLEVTSFFRITRERVFLESKIQTLLQEKLHFWDTYKEGFDSYDNLANDLNRFFDSMETFASQLEEIHSISHNQHEKLITMRLFSIYHCIILNQLPEALKYEEQIDNIKKRFLCADKEKLSPIVFLKDNLVICEASFLNNEGKILESSKTEKLARFFGYSPEDLKLLNSLDNLMPDFIAEHHHELVFRSFLKTRKEQILHEWEVVSHAIDKEGFLFPIKLFLGFNFHYSDDYVANAGMLRLQESGYEEILLNDKGMILGFNRELFHFFREEYPTLSLNRLKTVCFYSLAPRIKEIIENDRVFVDNKSFVYRNQSSSIFFPANLDEIIDLLEFYYSELNIENNSNANINNNSSRGGLRSAYASSTYRTNRSGGSTYNASKIKSLKNNKDLMIRLTNFLSGKENLLKKKEYILKIFQENTLNQPEYIINKMMQAEGMKRSKAMIDLSFRFYQYGKTSSQIIKLSRVIFSKLSHLEEISKENNLAFKKNDVFEDSAISEIFSHHGGIVLPPNNEVEFGFEFERNSVSNSGRSNKEELKIEVIKDEINQQKGNKKPENFHYDIQIQSENQNEINLLRRQEEENEKNEEIWHEIAYQEKPNDDLNFISKSEMEKNKAISLKSSFKTTEENILKRGFATTEQFVKEIELEASQKSSSNSSGKKAFNVLSIISLLKKKLPKSMFQILYLLIMQIILILIFCVIYYVIAGQYISNAYIPLKLSLIRQLETNHGIYFSTLLFSEYENIQKGFSTGDTNFMNRMYEILNSTYFTTKNFFYEDRNAGYSFSFSHYFQDTYIDYVDYVDFQPKSILLADFTDNLLSIMSDFLQNPNLDDNLKTLNVFQRNFLAYLRVSKSLRDEIQAEFELSNELVNNKLVIVLGVALSLIALWKVIEYFLLSNFYGKITRLFNIFLRTTTKEALNESFFIKDIQSSLKDQKKTYMMTYFSERLLCKQNYIAALEDEGNSKLINSNKTQQKKSGDKKTHKNKKHLHLKSTRNISAFGLVAFSKLRILAFLLITLSAGVLYFVFNYYFWMKCNDNIENLLLRTNLFNNLFAFSSSVLGFHYLMIREQIIRDPLYEKTGAYYQIHDNRISELNQMIKSRLSALGTYVASLPNSILSAEAELNDEVFTEIVESNVCDALIRLNYIGSSEQSICESSFNGAFYKGILSIMNEFLNFLKSLSYLVDIDSIITTEDQTLRVENIKGFIKSGAYGNSIISTYYVTQGLKCFYDFFSDFYLSQLYTNIDELISFVWIMSSICLVVMFSIMIYSWKFLKRFFNHAVMALHLIPLEKLCFDEQTIFLIRSFYKDNL